MKKVLYAAMVLSLFIVFSTSCSKSNVTPEITTPVNPLTVVTSGNLTLSSLTQRGEDKTSQFQGYTFSFLNGGMLKASKSGLETIGNWTFTPSAVSYYGSTPSNSSITINIGAEKPLSQISRIWNIDSTATTASKLALISPEVNENMRLIFTRQ